MHIFNAVRRRRGATGLWRSIVGIVTEAKSRGCDAVLICEDDHTFTYAYNENCFINGVFRAAEYGAQLLLGGIGNFHNAVPVDDGMMWVDCFWCTQFMIVYSTAYDDILKADFNEKIDVADEFLSTILSNKLVITPFISVQRDFGYSDVTKNNNNNSIITQHFERAIHKQKAYQRIFNKYGLNRQSSTKPTLRPCIHILHQR